MNIFEKYKLWTSRSEISSVSIFWVFILFMILYYNYVEIAFYRPQSIHIWRQTDCLSQPLMYYQYDNSFLRPEMHGQTADNRRTGIGASEFPIFYYFISILYGFFGYHEFIYRIVNTLILIIGLYYVFKFSSTFLNDKYLPTFVALFLFTSPLLVFYGNNFIMNTTALSFSFIGLYWLGKYYNEPKQKYLYLIITFCTIAVLIKLSELIVYFSIIGLYLYELLGITKLKNKNKLFSNRLKTGLFFLGSLFIIFLWYNYANNINKAHHQEYYAFQTGHFWSLTQAERDAVWYAISNVWIDAYYMVASLFVLLFLFIFSLVFYRYSFKILNLLMISSVIGSFGFFFLWFSFLSHHDYYLISALSSVLFILVNFIYILFKIFEIKKSIIYYFKIVFVVFLLLNMNHAKAFLKKRYGIQNDTVAYYNDYYDITVYLRKLGINPEDKVISLPDQTPNVSLYLMNQRGWSSFLTKPDTSSINYYIKNGAKYLIINQKNFSNSYFVNPYLYHLIGKYKNIYIYKLDGVVDNSFSFNPLLNEYVWDIENTNGNAIIPYDYSKKLSGIVSDKIAHSGKNSVLLTKDQPYSMTYNVDSVVAGTEYDITVWRYQTGKSGVIIATIHKPEDFYLIGETIIDTDKNGWQLIQAKFTIPDKLDKKKMSIYLWNVKDSIAYFDDLSIKIRSK